MFFIQQLPSCSSAGVVCSMVHDLTSHSAYKITSYNLGAIRGFQNNGFPNPATDSKPLFITKSTADTLNSEQLKPVFPGETPSADSLNINSIALSAQYDATKKISLQGAFGVTRNLWTPDLFDNMKGSSWEANLGVVYKLLNNHFIRTAFRLYGNRRSFYQSEQLFRC